MYSYNIVNGQDDDNFCPVLLLKTMLITDNLIDHTSIPNHDGHAYKKLLVINEFSSTL